jgi:hypothetical protein
MARALPFIPFSTTIDLAAGAPAPALDAQAKLRRRAEELKDQIYRGYVSRFLDGSHAQEWSSLDRNQKLALVGRVAELRARKELAQIEASGDARPVAARMADFVQRHGGAGAEGWAALGDDDQHRVFFATAVRCFLKQVATEVLDALRTETQRPLPVPGARA